MLDWFNYYGLIAVVIIMIPNIVLAVKHKDEFENLYSNARSPTFLGRGKRRYSLFGCL